MVERDDGDDGFLYFHFFPKPSPAHNNTTDVTQTGNAEETYDVENIRVLAGVPCAPPLLKFGKRREIEKP